MKRFTFSSVCLCDYIERNTLDSQSAEDDVTTTQYDTVHLNCPEDGSILTIKSAVLGSGGQANCTVNVRDIVAKLCSSTKSSKTCTFPVTNEYPEDDPCFDEPSGIEITYSCSQPGKYLLSSENNIYLRMSEAVKVLSSIHYSIENRRFYWFFDRLYQGWQWY